MPDGSMPRSQKNPRDGLLFRYYGIAFSTVCLAAVVRILLDPYVGNRAPTLTFFLAIVVTALFAGLMPGLFATVLSMFVASILFFELQGTVYPSTTSDWVLIGYFSLTGVVVSIMGEMLIRAKIRRGLYAEKILEEREKLRVLLSSIGDAVIATDIAENITFMNPIAETLTGWSGSESIGKPLNNVFRIINETSREPVTSPVKKVLETGHIVGPANHTLLIAHDGSEYPIDDSAAPVRNEHGDLFGTILVFRNIADKKKADQALRESEGRLRFLDTLSKAVGDAASAETVMSITTQMLGAELQATRCAYADVEPDEDRFTIRHDWTNDVPSVVGEYNLEAFGRQTATNLRMGETLVITNVDQELESGNGAETFNLINIKAIICCPLRKDGKLVAMMAVHQSTPRAWTKAEINLVESVVDRSWAHIQRIRSQIELYQVLQDADRRKDEFLATLAHELRNPLAPIRTGLQVLKLSSSEEARLKSREMMERQLSHMVRLIDDLLDVSRITRGKVELKKELVDLHSVIANAVETSLPVIQSGKHALKVELPHEPLLLDADPTRLAQVFSNLLNNAAKYTAENGTIVVAARRESTWILVTITDSGVGIPKEMLSEVFQMFTQVGKSLERSQGGLGIGLTLVRRLTEMHGGEVTAESLGVGTGSTFSVRLPLATQTINPSRTFNDTLGSEQQSAPKQLKILVVDDNIDGATTLSMLLTIHGHTTQTAHSGWEAMSVRKVFLPDIIFLDIGLPGLNGYEVAKQIRQDGSEFAPVLVAITGWGSQEDKQKAREAGFDFHLTKPVEAAEIERLISKIVESNQLRLSTGV